MQRAVYAHSIPALLFLHFLHRFAFLPLVNLLGYLLCRKWSSTSSNSPILPQLSDVGFQSSTYQLALSPGSPAWPSNCGNKVRFVLEVIWKDRLLSAAVFMWAVMMQHINPSSCNLSRWWREVKLHVIDLKEQHPYSLSSSIDYSTPCCCTLPPRKRFYHWEW